MGRCRQLIESRFSLRGGPEFWSLASGSKSDPVAKLKVLNGYVVGTSWGKVYNRRKTVAKAPKYSIPDLSNATDGGLVDMLAIEREKMAEAKFYEGFYKEALKSRLNGRTSVKGEKFLANITTSESERFDIKQCREDAEKGNQIAKDALENYLAVSEVFTVRTNALPDDATI
jgi:hypothetical protein